MTLQKQIEIEILKAIEKTSLSDKEINDVFNCSNFEEIKSKIRKIATINEFAKIMHQLGFRINLAIEKDLIPIKYEAQ